MIWVILFYLISVVSAWYINHLLHRDIYNIRPTYADVAMTFMPVVNTILTIIGFLHYMSKSKHIDNRITNFPSKFFRIK